MALTPQLSAGGGVFYQDRFKDFTSSTALLPSRLTADLTASYRLVRRASVRVNIKNVFDERYYLSGARNQRRIPAPPRAVQVAFVSTF